MTGLVTLPDRCHGVAGDGGVWRHQRGIQTKRLGDEQAIEGIAMPQRQLRRPKAVLAVEPDLLRLPHSPLLNESDARRLR